MTTLQWSLLLFVASELEEWTWVMRRIMQICLLAMTLSTLVCFGQSVMGVAASAKPYLPESLVGEGVVKVGPKV